MTVDDRFAAINRNQKAAKMSGARRHLRRLWRVGLGSLLIIAGLAMCVLPGPGLLTIVAGLALMADEVPFAQRIIDKLTEKARRLEEKVRDRF